MKKRFKTSTLFIVAVVLASFVSTGTVIAQSQSPCPEECTVTALKDAFSLAIMPDSNGQWPIVVPEPGHLGGTSEPGFYCDNPSNGLTGNYPCLAWNYKCVGEDCNNISATSAMIPICCDTEKPLETLWTSEGNPATTLTRCEANSSIICTASEFHIPPTSGPAGQLFWFTTPTTVGIGSIDVIFKVGRETLPCKSAIKGPDCSTLRDVRVEPRVQCWQFTADTTDPDCPEEKSQTWYAEWSGSDPCAVDVWVADGIVPCSQVKVGDPLPEEEVSDMKIDTDGDGIVDQTLTEARTNNSRCDEFWLRFTDEEGCNVRCYYSGGTRRCY